MSFPKVCSARSTKPGFPFSEQLQLFRGNRLLVSCISVFVLINSARKSLQEKQATMSDGIRDCTRINLQMGDRESIACMGCVGGGIALWGVTEGESFEKLNVTYEEIQGRSAKLDATYEKTC